MSDLTKFTSVGLGGWHVNATGGHKGDFSGYLTTCRELGVPPVVCAVDDAGLAVEIALAGGIAVFSKDFWRVAPDYTLPAQEAARVRWGGIKAAIPPEITAIRDRVIIEIMNEPDQKRADYVFTFMLEVARLANLDGYRVGGPSWSTGTPHIDAWTTPAGLAFLRYCADHPRDCLVLLHEYSLDPQSIKTGAPYLVGRFDFILDACDNHGIGHPHFIITECGWTYDNLPSNGERVVEDLEFLLDLYREIPFCLWTLGSWHAAPDLPKKLAPHVRTLSELVRRRVEEGVMTWQEEVWKDSVDEQQQRGVHLNRTFTLQSMIMDMGYFPVTRETAISVGSDVYGYQVGERRDGSRIVLAFKRPWSGPSGVRVIQDPN